MTFVNFTVTRGSLQTQCLNQVLKAERPDVDKKRSDLLKLQGEFLLRLRHLEQSLLQALNEVKGRILDDDRYAIHRAKSVPLSIWLSWKVYQKCA